MLVRKPTSEAPIASPAARPTAVAKVHVTSWRRSKRSAQAWTAPRTAPVMSPPATALPALFTGSVTISAASPPRGKPMKDTIQRATMRPVGRVGEVGWGGGDLGHGCAPCCVRGHECCGRPAIQAASRWSGCSARWSRTRASKRSVLRAQVCIGENHELPLAGGAGELEWPG